jgi:hypothetical protein
MPNRKDERIGIIGVADNIRSDYKPMTTGEYLSGMFIIVIGALIAFWMYLNHKSKSPTAQAEATLKANLTTELTEFKNSINQDTRRLEKDQAGLDKRVSLNERDYTELKVQVNKIDSKLNAQFGSLHNTITEGNESLMSIILEKKRN